MHLFIMGFCYAHRAFAITFPPHRHQAFFASDVAAFDFFAGVRQQISYDNRTTAVQLIFTGRTRTERHPTQ